MTDLLPELTKPGNGSIQVGREEISLGYSADQMRAYGQAAIKAEREACAKVCDDFGDDYMIQAREGDNSGASDHKACAAAEIADEIRSRAAAIRARAQG